MSARTLTRDGFARELARFGDVSRETIDRFQAFADLLTKWQAKVNLVGGGTLDDLWRRHLIDSAQISGYLPPGPCLDAGTGAGFPGLVLAILAAADHRPPDRRPGPFHLVESDQRKCAFLAEALRVTGAKAQIHNHRVESLVPVPVASITARALAPLPRLLDLVAPHLGHDTRCLFLKGKDVDAELTEARQSWKMRVERIPSATDPAGVLLILSEITSGRDQPD